MKGQQAVLQPKPLVPPSDRTLELHSTAAVSSTTSELPHVGGILSLIDIPLDLVLPSVPSKPFVQLVSDLLATHTMPDQRKGIAGMPVANTARAPLFSGKMRDVFKEFEQQAESCGLTPAEKCSVIVQYLGNRKTQNLWKNAVGWKDGKWEEFKVAVLDKYLDADKADRLTLHDLERIVVKQRKKDIDTIADFFDYHHKFCSIAISLLASKALSTSDHDCYFWEGLHKDAKHSILQCIKNTIKDYNLLKPINMDDVTLAARYIFSDDIFKRNCNNPVAMQLRSLTKDDDSSSDEDVRRKKTSKKKKEVTSDEDDSDLDGNQKRRCHRKNRKAIIDSDSEDEERIQKRKMRRPGFESEDKSSDEEDR